MASGENVQLVRRAYEAWNAHGPGAIEPFVADAVELRDAPELPDSGSWSGRDAVVARLAEVAEAVGSSSGELEEFRALGDDVLVAIDWQLEDDPPGEASLGRVFHVVRVADGMIARISVFLDEAAAISAAEEAS